MFQRAKDVSLHRHDGVGSEVSARDVLPDQVVLLFVRR